MTEHLHDHALAVPGLRPTRLLAAYAAGFVAVPACHQPLAELLHLAGLRSAQAFNFRPVPPFDVPAVISLAFWGGVWGIPLLLLMDRLPRTALRWVCILAFAGLAPTFVGWFLVAPLKGVPVGNGWRLASIWMGPVLNAAWGLGAALLIRMSERPAAGARSLA